MKYTWTNQPTNMKEKSVLCFSVHWIISWPKCCCLLALSIIWVQHKMWQIPQRTSASEVWVPCGSSQYYLTPVTLGRNVQMIWVQTRRRRKTKESANLLRRKDKKFEAIIELNNFSIGVMWKLGVSRSLTERKVGIITYLSCPGWNFNIAMEKLFNSIIDCRSKKLEISVM